jgi:phosphoesterase RecJ-like protein
MTYQTPKSRSISVQEVLDLLGSKECAILTTHMNADGDGIGSEVALAAWLRARGTKAYIVNPTPIPKSLRFLVPNESWVLDPSEQETVDYCHSSDVAIVLDAGEVERIGRVKPLIDSITTVVIDHHPIGNKPIEGISLRDSTASATGELVFDLIMRAGGPWPDVADLAIYVAILTDTGSFRFSNSTPASHNIVAELIRRGVKPDEMYRHFYGTFPYRRLRLLQCALEELKVDSGSQVAWMTVPPKDYQDLAATAEDLDGFVDYPRSIEGVEVGILFWKPTKNSVKISFRSNGTVDVNELARRFGGGGHVRAAGAMIKGDLEQVRNEVIAETIVAVELLGTKR